MTEFGSPVLYVAAVAWGLTVAIIAGYVDLTLEHGLPPWEVADAD